jgi:hypothetical protein
VRTREALRASAAGAAVGSIASGEAIDAVDPRAERVLARSTNGALIATVAGGAVHTIDAVGAGFTLCAAGTSGANDAVGALVAGSPVVAVLTALSVSSRLAGAADVSSQALRSIESIRALGAVHA